MIFDNIKVVVLDLDGVIWTGDTVISGAIETVNLLQQKYNVIFYSNVSSTLLLHTWNKINNFGITCNIKDVYLASSLTIDYLVENKINDVYVIGSKELEIEIRNNDIDTQYNKAKHVVVGMDRDFNYDKMCKALNILLKKDSKFIICNEDSSFPSTNNTLLPGCGAIVGSLVYTSKRKPDVCVGKPGIYGLTKIAKRFNITNKEMLVIGDSMESDIQMAKNYNCKAIKIGNTYDNENGYLLYVKNLEDIYNEFIRI